MHGNEIEEEWREEKRREYGQVLEQTKRRENDSTEMWLLRVWDSYWNVKIMKFDVREDNIKKVLMELKVGKAGRPDGLKPELYKVLKESRVVVKSLKKGKEKLLEDEGEPER